MNGRNITLDITRGLVVATMVITHVLSVLGGGKNALNIIRDVGNIVAFTSFLFIFGMTLYKSVFAQEYNPALKQKQLFRIYRFLIIYYILAFFGVIFILQKEPDYTIIYKTIFFLYMPNLLEFMLPFIIYTLIALIIKKYLLPKPQLYYFKDNVWRILAIGITIFIIGNFLHNIFTDLTITSSSDIKRFIALLWGNGSIVRYPLFQYSPILCLGLCFGNLFFYKISYPNNMYKNKMLNKLINNIFLLILYVTVGIWIESNFVSFKYIYTIDRWPPSVLFLSLGLCYCFTCFWTSTRINIRYFNIALAYLGRKPIQILLFHLIILRILEIFKFPTTDNIILLGIYIIIFLVGYKFIEFFYQSFKNKLILSFYE
jgi:uncharacterized membrane protein